MPTHQPRPAWSDIESRLRSIEQGDLISFGAISLTVRPDSQLARDAGAVLASGEDGQQAAGGGGGPEVITLTVETASGWYVVLSQDCDIVRSPEDEPCLAVAPVVYVTEEEWSKLHLGMTSYKQFPLAQDLVAPVDEAHQARIPEGHRPVVDIRYISSIDKFALADGFEQRHPLDGKNKLAFQQWVGARFGRESFADAVHERVLPAARDAIDTAVKASLRGGKDPAAKFVASVSEYWVRATDRYVEVLGRLEPNRGRAAGTLKRSQGVTAWNTSVFDQGCRPLSKNANQVMRGTGYTVKFVTGDFDELRAGEFETYALWHMMDEPPEPAV